MKVTAKMKYLGASSGTSRSSGKPYYQVGLLQDFDSVKFYVSKEIYDKAGTFKPYSDVDCQITTRSHGDKTYFDLNSIDLVK